MENKSHAIAAGAFVLALLAVLIGLAFWLSRDRGDYEVYELSTRDTVTGLQPQAQVRYKGVSVGKVTRIGFDPAVEGNVLLRIAVDRDAPVTDRTFASLNLQGVTGLAFIQLDEAKEPLPPIPPGASGLPRMPLRSSQLGQLLDRVPAILGQVDEATRRINQILGDDNQKRLAAVLDNAASATANIAQLTGRIEQTLATRVDPALAKVPVLVDQAGTTMASLRTAADKVSGTADSVRTTTDRLNAADGPLDRLATGTQALSVAADTLAASTLPRVNQVADDASRAMRQLTRTVNGIGDNPQALIFGNGTVDAGPGEPGFRVPVPGERGPGPGAPVPAARPQTPATR